MRQAIAVPACQFHSIATRYAHRLALLGAERTGASTWAAAAKEPEKPGRRTVHVDPRLQRLEAVLFVAREPLSSRKLSQYANLADGTEARTLVRLLNEAYDREGRAFRVEEIAGGYQLLTRTKFAPWLRKLGHVPSDLRLSAPALETLAIIAYRQPVLRAEIEGVRGVNCGEILRQLMERDLVCMSGRSEELGRPYVYATTRRFLQLFGLRGLEDLPRAEIYRKSVSAVVAPPIALPTASENAGDQ